MGDLVALRREMTRRAIEMNPTPLALKRVGKMPDGAGGEIDGEILLPEQTFRLFISSYQATKDIVQEGGQLQINQVGLLALHDADIKRGDSFEQDGRKYKVERVTPVKLMGEVVSIQCVLEEVV